MSRDSSEVPGPDPDAIAAQSFTRARKGFEVDEVRAFLVSVSSQVREAQRQREDLDRRLVELERRATDPRDLEVAEVSELLGAQTARVLDTARQAAAEMRSSAEEHAAQITAAADQQATDTREAAADYDATTRTAADEYNLTTRRSAADDAERVTTEAVSAAEAMRAEAAAILTDRAAEAESAGAAVRTEADTYATATRADADRHAESTRADADSYRNNQHEAGDAYRAEVEAEGHRLRSVVESEAATARAAIAAEAAEVRDAADVDAAAIREAARAEGRSMVDEARDYRDRVIADLADRRRAARAQLDQLAANRDALAVTLSDVASRIDASYQAVSGTVIDAPALGDIAADRAALADRPLPEQLEDPRPEDEADPLDQIPDDLEEPVEVDQATEPAAPEPDELPTEPAEAGEPAEPGETLAEDPADALFAQLKAATDAEAEVVATEADVDATEADATDGDDNGADPELATEADADAADGDGDGADLELATEATPDGIEAGGAGTPESAPEPTEGAGTDPEGAGADPEDVDPGVDADADLLDRRDAATDEIERQLAKRLKRVLSDEQNEALDRLRRVRGEASADQVLTSEDDHRARYRAAAMEDLTAAERAGAGFFGSAPDAPAAVDDVAETFAVDLVRALRGRLEAAFDDGGDEQEVGERIRACYREWKTQRIAEVARHSVQIAFGRGVAGYEADSPTRWLVDHGDEAAPDCDDNALAGVVAPGGAFPTGDHHPPIHPGCRCLAVPVET